MTFAQTLILMASCSVTTLLAVFLGGWLVFRTRNAQLGIPMIGSAPKKGAKPSRYVDLESMGMGDGSLAEELERELSPAAKRFRAQKGIASIDELRAATVGGK